MPMTTVTTRTGKKVSFRVDRFGFRDIDGRPFPHDLKARGMAFAWQLRNGDYRTWIPGQGWSSPGTREECQESAYCYNHDC